jgi:hypothetical protein
MEFYFLNWVQLSYDFGKVVLSGPPKEKFVVHEAIKFELQIYQETHVAIKSC